MFVYCFSRHFSRLEDTRKGLDLDVFIENPISVGSHVEVANAGCKLQQSSLILPPKNGSPKRQITVHPGMLRMNVDEFRWYIIILLYLTGIFSRCQDVKDFTFSLLSFLSSQHSQWKTSVNGAYSIAMNREYRFCSPVPVWFPLCSKHVTHQPDNIWQRSRPRSQCIRSSTTAGTSWNQMWS